MRHVDVSSQIRLAGAQIQRKAKAIPIDIINKRGSRMQAKFHGQELARVFKEDTAAHEAFMEELDPNDDDYSDIWIEDIGFIVNSCNANLAEYLQEREMNTPSEAPSEYFLYGELTSSSNDTKAERSSVTPQRAQLKKELSPLTTSQIEQRLNEEQESSLSQIKLAELE
eukprot:Seg3110.2 transcript_id=Seg3110.2/GoldUCD/mRNA.D3Y31 product="hypothetical protein" protein_id=Seg3110.2/GoldUCD/D3Y31